MNTEWGDILIDIRLLTFITVSKIKSYTKAAEILNLTQPAVSQHIKHLEEYYGVKLIKKDGKLYRHRDGTPDIELKPESQTKFFYGDGTDRQIEFEVDSMGKLTKAWFINTGQKGELKKIE